MLNPASAPILYDVDAEGIARITLNRPKVLNALNADMLDRLSALLEHIRRDDSVAAVILTGNGGDTFSAGADIRYLNGATALDVRALAQLAVRVTGQIESLGKVVVAALNGHTYGGGLEIAEACMIRIVAKGALIGHPEVRIGAVAGFGGTTRLARLVGKGRAAEMLLSGRAISADEALRIGLVQSVVAREALLDEAHTVIRDILSHYPTAVRLTWEALHRGLNMSLEESAALGADYFGLIASTPEFREGTSAFLERHARKKNELRPSPILPAS